MSSSPADERDIENQDEELPQQPHTQGNTSIFRKLGTWISHSLNHDSTPPVIINRYPPSNTQPATKAHRTNEFSLDTVQSECNRVRQHTQLVFVDHDTNTMLFGGYDGIKRALATCLLTFKMYTNMECDTLIHTFNPSDSQIEEFEWIVPSNKNHNRAYIMQPLFIQSHYCYVIFALSFFIKTNITIPDATMMEYIKLCKNLCVAYIECKPPSDHTKDEIIVLETAQMAIDRRVTDAPKIKDLTQDTSKLQIMKEALLYANKVFFLFVFFLCAHIFLFYLLPRFSLFL